MNTRLRKPLRVHANLAESAAMTNYALNRIPIVLLLCSICVDCFTARGQTTNTPARWEKDILAFEASDRTNAPPKGAVLFVGSSSIRLWKTLETDFPMHRVINRGFGGSQLSDSLAFAERIILPHQPRMVILYAGDNDLAGGKSPDRVVADFESFAKLIHERLPNTRVGYIAIKPSTKRQHLGVEIRETNQRIAALCQQDPRRVFFDVYTPMIGVDGYPRAELLVADGLHMTPEGYKLWTAIVAKELP